MSEQGERVVKTLCRMCGMCCGISTYFEGDKLVRWEPAPEYKWLGGKCPRWKSMADYQYSVDRLTHPLRRVNGEFKRITWDEAFDIIVSKLNEVKEKHGPEYVAINIGHPHILGPIMYFVPRVCHAFGTPNFPLGGNYCWMPHTLADYITFGTGAYMLPRYRGNECAVFWGGNPLMSAPPQATRKMFMKTKNEGVKWIVVDPRKIELAKKSDVYLPIRPGTDGALALGWLNVIISEGLYDKEFVEKWTLGFDKLVELVKDYPPEKVAKICWVSEDLIRDAARMYATSKPATMSGGVSLDQHTNAFQTSRAISCLKAITGNVDKFGASTYIGLPPIDLQMRERVVGKRRMGEKELPLWYDEFRASNDQQEIPLTPMIDDIMEEKIKAVIFMGKNMVVEDPNTNRILEAFTKLDLIVNMDLFMTESCKVADIVLPAATFLEKNSIRFYHQGSGLALVAPVLKAVEPLGECKSDLSFLLELVNRLSLSEFFPWKNDEEVLDHILKQVGTSFEYLKEHSEGYWFAPREFERHEKYGKFETESGKIELYSNKMKRYGYDPLPTYVEPAESPVSTPEVAKVYPLILTSGGRTNVYEQSSHRNLPKVRRLFPEPLIEINPEDAKRYGIEDRDLVEVESLRGTMRVKAHVTEDMRPSVVHAYHGWGGISNVNLLTPDHPYDPVSGGAALRSSLCRIRSLHNRD